MLDPHDLLPLLLPWSVERSRGIHDGAVVRTSTNDDGTTTVQRARLTYPPPFNLAALTLFRQVSPHCTPAIAPNPARGVLGIGRMAGLPTCPVRDPVTQVVRDVDLLQEHIFASGMSGSRLVYARPSAAAPDLAAGSAAAGLASLGGRGPGRGVWAGERVGVEREDGGGEGLPAEAAAV